MSRGRYKRRCLIIAEGRGAWCISKGEGIYLDIAPINIIQACIKAKEALERGEKPILVFQIDRGKSTESYSFPKNFEGSLEIYKRVMPIVIFPENQAHLKQRFLGFKDRELEEFFEIKEEMSMKEFEEKTTRKLALFTLERLGIKDDVQTILIRFSPDKRGLWGEKVKEQMEFLLEGEAREVYERIKRFNTFFMMRGRDAYSIPIFYEFDGRLISFLTYSIKRGRRVKISKGGELGNVIYDLEEYIEIIKSRELYIKYPLVVLDYVHQFLEVFGLSKKIELRKIVESTDVSEYLKKIIKEEEKRKVRLERVVFVEGDEGGVNELTGGIAEKFFEELAKAFYARYERVISLERSSIEREMKKQSHRELVELIIRWNGFMKSYLINP